MEGVLNAVFVYGGNLYLADSFAKQLEKMGCNVSYKNAEKIIEIDKDFDERAIIIYLSEIVLKSLTPIILYKDIAVDKNIPIYIIGSPEEIGHIKDYFAGCDNVTYYERPIDTTAVVKEIIKKFSNTTYFVKKKILCVDDSPVSLKLLQDILDKDYQVYIATSALQAIKIIGKIQPDLMILDYEMPCCNGIMLLDMIRQDTDCEDIPVVFYTGHTDRDDTIECMRKGIAGFLLKTNPSSDIRKYIDAFFSKGKK